SAFLPSGRLNVILVPILSSSSHSWWRSIEPALGHDLRLPVVLLAREPANMVEQHLCVARQDGAVYVLGGVPQARAHQRLRAVQERLLDGDHEADLRRALGDGARRQQARVVSDARRAVDAQRLV